VSQATLTGTAPGQFRLSGDLDFGNVAPLVEAGERLFADHRDVRIDLSGVGQANSAGLALVLEWLDQARRRGRRLELIHLPESLTRIAAITNLTGLLPTGPDAPQQPEP